jgi:hypothetical protein
VSEDKEFKWSETDSVVIRAVEALAVYTNPTGDVVIRQQNSMGDEDHFIVIPPDRIEDLITALKNETERR